MTKKEREVLVKRHAVALATLYRNMASELTQAASVLDHAGDLHDAFPVVSASVFSDAIKAGAVLRYIVDNQTVLHRTTQK